VNAPSRSDLDVLESLDKGADPTTVPQDAIERLAELKLVTLRPPGRVMLTGTAKEVLLRREYGLPLPLVQEPEAETEAEAEDKTDDAADGEDEPEIHADEDDE
jgi:hypothetical protein